MSSLIPTSQMMSADIPYNGPLALRPLYPRSQYTSTPRVNAGDIIQAASAGLYVLFILK